MISQLSTSMKPFHVMKILARAQALAAQGRSIVHMEVGEPDFDTPAPIVAAGHAALDKGLTKYTPAKGIQPLREAISQYYLDEFGVNVPFERIIITPGASGALMLSMGISVNPGDKIITSDPGYPCNDHFIAMYGATSHKVNVDSASGYQITPAHIDAVMKGAGAPSVNGLLIASPANPTGSLLTPRQVDDLWQCCQHHGLNLYVDEIYQGIVYNDEARHSALAISADIFVINSFSKFFGMTGWRLGWVVVPDAFVDAADRFMQNMFLSAPTVAQYAALSAFSPQTQAILKGRVEKFKQRRDYLLDALRQTPLRVNNCPQGAFYAYADISAIHKDANAFCDALLEEEGVAATPGIDFGCYRADTHVRFAYTTDVRQMSLAMERLKRFTED